MLSFCEANNSWFSKRNLFSAICIQPYCFVKSNILNILSINVNKEKHEQHRKLSLSFDHNFSWLSSQKYLQAKSLQRYRSLAQNIQHLQQSPEPTKTRLPFFEYIFSRIIRTQRPPEPPPPTLLQRIGKALKWEGIVFTREITAASIASVATVVVTQPLDAVKNYYFSLPQRYRKGRYLAMSPKFLVVVPKMFRTGRVPVFYEGHIQSLRDNLFQTISMFYSQERIYQQLAVDGFDKYPNVCCFASGFLSATFAVVALKPYAVYVERQKTRQYLSQKFGPIDRTHLLRREHPLTFFRGCFPEFMFLGTQYGIRFLFYNLIRDHILNKRNRAIAEAHAKLNPLDDLDSIYRIEPIIYLNHAEAIAAGAISGIASEVLAHPLEVVQARLQMGALERQQYRYVDTCRHYHQCFWLILRKQNIRNLYIGITPTLIKSMISVGVQFSVYDKVSEWLDNNFGKPESKKIFTQ